MQRSSQRLLVSALGFTALGLVAAAALSESVENLVRRYPYDPACPWGRIGNGKGIIVRCLSEAEAQALRAGTVAALPASAASAAPSAWTPTARARSCAA